MIINGDCLEVLKTYPDNHFTSIVTDPPYGLSFMGKKWDYDVPSIAIWQECLRVLKPGGTMLCFAGSRTQHRMACNIEDAGFLIKDCILWIYGSGFPKSLNVGKAVDKIQGNEREFVKTISSHDITSGGLVGKEYSRQDVNVTKGTSDFEGYGTALKPAYEPIIMCMKPNDGTYAENAIKWGVSGINVDKSRIGTEENTKRNNHRAGIWQDKELEHITGGHIQGRFPANILLDQEAAEMLDEQSGVSASRFFYCAKASPSERAGSNHPTVKPKKLMKYLINLIAPPKDAIILDCFMGSGTTGVCCKELGINFVGIEKELDYFNDAKNRISNARVLKEEERLC